MSARNNIRRLRCESVFCRRCGKSRSESWVSTDVCMLTPATFTWLKSNQKLPGNFFSSFLRIFQDPADDIYIYCRWKQFRLIQYCESDFVTQYVIRIAVTFVDSQLTMYKTRCLDLNTPYMPVLSSKIYLLTYWSQ